MSSESSKPRGPVTISRRVFVGSVASLGLCPLLSACEFVEVYDTEVGEGASFDLSEADFAELATVGGTACISLGALELLLVRVDDEQVGAFERFCPHANLDMGNCGGNPIPAEWDAQAGHLICRWHRSIFDVDGNLVSGPSPRGLRVFPVEFDPATGFGRVLAASGSGGDE
jgi:nitrite reductase/ring-hydroxylating ferredoxin subunit